MSSFDIAYRVFWGDNEDVHLRCGSDLPEYYLVFRVRNDEMLVELTAVYSTVAVTPTSTLRCASTRESIND